MNTQTAIQGSRDWHEWRRQGLGASDAPVIMNASPWRTRFDLWADKTGRRLPEPSNWAQQRGLAMESQARAYYELLTGIDVEPALFVHAEHSFLRASLDGRNAALRLTVEIKCPGKVDHAVALAGKIPEKYVWQLVHQLAVTGDDSVDYFSYQPGKGVIVPFKRDLLLEERLLEAEMEFWKLVKSDTPPERTVRAPKRARKGDNIFRLK